MKEIILAIAEASGKNFADFDRRECDDLDQKTLLDAFHTGQVTSNEVSNAFLKGVFNSLGLEDGLFIRRDELTDKIYFALKDILKSEENSTLSNEEIQRLSFKIANRLIFTLM